jgi:tRNA dimethylallyltransferase
MPDACRKMIAIVGPTAVGKSDLALHVARYFNAEIISADSRQVYRYMDIGTNKPSLAERASVPHHVVDVVDPDQSFSLAMYHEAANAAMQEICGRGKLPLLVGGTGLYVWSLVEGWKIPAVEPDRELRQRLEARATQDGSRSLHRELQDIDPEAAARINPHNTRRIIRALEIHRATGRLPSQLRRKATPGFASLIIGLTQERGELYSRVDARVDRMLDEGLVEEVEQLLKRGYQPSLPSLSGIGYRQIVQLLRGEVTLPEAVARMRYETHRLVRHQYAWFRLSDKRIHWLEVHKEETRRAAVASEARHLVEGLIS